MMFGLVTQPARVPVREWTAAKGEVVRNAAYTVVLSESALRAERELLTILEEEADARSANEAYTHLLASKDSAITTDELKRRLGL